MQNILLTGIHGRPSMKNVYSKMTTGELLVRRQLPHKLYYRHYQHNDSSRLTKLIQPNFNESRVIIRWGTQEQLPTPNAIIYNEAKALALVSNKYKSRLKFAEHDVPIPLNVTLNTDRRYLNFPIIARPLHHSKGKNFVTLNNYAEFERHYRNNHNGWYYSNFVDKVAEYRVHTASGKIINYLKKPNPGPNQIAWNRAQNHEAFESVKWGDYNYAVGMAALQACEVLKCDFLGVDVIVDRYGEPYVLEGNSAPTLNSSEYSCQRYAKYFDWLFRSPVKREHWNFRQFQDAESFAWKNFQFEQ